MMDDQRFATKLTALLIAAVFVAELAVASDLDGRFLQGLGDSHYLRMESETVGRDYHVFVMLPDGYQEHLAQTYPTVYVLDGGALFPLLVSYYQYLNFGEEIPDSIIVGISYGADSYEDGNYRSTDYTAESDEREYWGGASKFQDFLRNEMIPYVESNYRSRRDRRIIFGQSLGGQFVLFTALTKPDLFWGHIASNPALHRNLSFFLQDFESNMSSPVPSKLFVASGSEDNPEFRVPALAWIEHWSSKEVVPWELETMTLEGHSHMSAPPASFRQGMRWLFSRQ